MFAMYGLGYGLHSENNFCNFKPFCFLINKVLTVLLSNPLNKIPTSGKGASFRKLGYCYSGKHSEGNRFITDIDL